MRIDKFLIYEINTRVWLNTLSRRYNKTITLANIPETVVDELAKLNVSAIWLMGVWTRSKGGREGALRYKHEYKGALPDLTDADVIGSAYAIGKYEVAEEAGGRAGMAAFRSQLQRRNMGLIVDFVPNHVALDHAWVTGDDGLCVRGTPELLAERPSDFIQSVRPDGTTVITAHGRDPNFPPWNDTAQLNAFSPVLRQAAIATLRDLALQSDGVRCDMAMLMLNEIFQRTWGWLVGDPPLQDFWPEVIAAVRQVNPGFIFMAEAYWGLEGVLQQQGFDYTYDKHTYDLLRDEKVPELIAHLGTDIGYQQHSIRFIENHDEPRAAEAFAGMGGEKHRCAATVTMTLPGAVLLHDGQFEGRRIKLPVQITREMDEPVDPALRAFYTKLLAEVRSPIYARGTWMLLPVTGNIIAYTWTLNQTVRLIIANITGETQSGAVTLVECGKHPLVNINTNQIIAPYGDRLEVYMTPYLTNIYEIDTSGPEQLTFSEKVANKITGVYQQVRGWIKGDGSRG